MSKLIPLLIEGSYLFESITHEDERGYFREWFKSSTMNEFLSKEFKVEQANISKSNKGVVRGIHFSLAPRGQAKWVACAAGALWDVVVDIRPNSPTFGRWDAHELRADDGRSLFISEGLGHAFLALEEETIISYLLSTPYSPSHEWAINPLDPDIGIPWPADDLSLSEKDASAPSLREFLNLS